jgi:Toxin PAAR-like domain
MFANCSMPGQDMAMPDVCRTPAPPPVVMVPIPYPNIAMRLLALPPTTSMKDLILFMPSHHLGTTIPISNGDQPGVLGGVVSQIIMGPSRSIRCSTKVLTGGMPATRMLDNTMQNLTNTSGMTLVPCQTKIIYLT